MKGQLLILLAILCSALIPAYSMNVSNAVSSKDTVQKLEKRIAVHLKNIHQIIEEKLNLLDAAKKEMEQNAANKHEDKNLKNYVSRVLSELEFDYQKQNAYRLLLTMIRQLKIQDESNATKQLKEIDLALKKLDKNQLPDIPPYHSIPKSPFMRDNTFVSDKKICSLCNLQKSPDGKIIANEFERFFEFTDPKISNYFRDSDFLQCDARFIKSKKEYYLELKFILNSPKASSMYGTIDPSLPSKIDFMNGDFIYLKTHSVTTGIQNQETGSIYYDVQFKLDGEDINNIRKNEIDTLTIIWTSGADEFEICKMDLLRNMFACIQKRTLQN